MFKNNKRTGLISALTIITLILIAVFFGRNINDATNIKILGINLKILILFCVIVIGLFAGTITYYEYHGFGSQVGIIRRMNIGPYVALTFDDGPSSEYTPKILDILKEYNVKATFFVVGKHVKKYPEVAKRILAEGHDIGNHTYTHKDLVPAIKDTVIKEITKTEETITKVLGIKTNLFRPPRGIYNQSSRKILVDKGYKIILWNVSSCDWLRGSPNMIINRIKRYTKNGSIILFHDSGSLVKREGGQRVNTVRSLPLVIEYLQENGYKILPISEMLTLGEAKVDVKTAEI